MSGNCPHRVIEIYTGPRGNIGPQGLSGSAGPSLPFSYTTGSTFATTSSIEITGSLTVSGSNTFKNIGPAIFSGSVNISSSLYVLGNTSGSFTGSLFGTASYANNSNTASYLLNSTPPFPYTGSAIITGSLNITGSISLLPSASGLTIRDLIGTPSQIAFYSNVVPSSTNYFLTATSTGGSVYLNADTTTNLQWNGSTWIQLNSTGVTFQGNLRGINGINLTLSSGSINLNTGSLNITGSLRVLAESGSLINLGNATTQSQRLVRIGQDAAFVDIGSLVGWTTAYAGIYMNHSSPDGTNFTLADTNLHDTWLNSESGRGVYIKVGGTTKAFFLTSNTQFDLANSSAPTVGTPYIFNIPSHTNQSSGSNIPNFKIVGSNKQWQSGSIFSQYWNYISGNTASFNSSSAITQSFGLFVESAITSSTSVILNNHAIGTSGSILISNPNTAANIILRDWVSANSLAAIYFGTSPASDNYFVIGDGNDNYVNGKTSINLRVASTTKINITSTSTTFSQNAASSGAVTNFTFSPSVNVAQTAGVNIPNFIVSGSNKQWTGGTVPVQYWNYFTANTASFTGTGSLISASYGLFVEAAVMGTAATASRNFAAGFSGSTETIGNIFVTGSSIISGSSTITGSLDLFNSTTNGITFANYGTLLFRATFCKIDSTYASNGDLGLYSLATTGFKINGIEKFQVNTNGANLTGSLNITGSIIVSGATSSFFGHRISQVIGGNSTFFGFEAGLNDNLTASTAVAFGYQALKNNVSGFEVSAFGNSALLNSTANDNTGIGFWAGKTISSGGRNTVVGSQAMSVGVTTGTDNTAVGYVALQNVTGGENIAIGSNSGKGLTSGIQNTYIGNSTGFTGSGVSNNIFIGYFAGRYETTGSSIIIDSIDRTSETNQRLLAPIYGKVNSNILNQSLTFNVATASFTTGSLIVTGSIILSPSGSFVLPQTASIITPQIGSAYFTGSFLYIFDGIRYRSASLA